MKARIRGWRSGCLCLDEAQKEILEALTEHAVGKLEVDQLQESLKRIGVPLPAALSLKSEIASFLNGNVKVLLEELAAAQRAEAAAAKAAAAEEAGGGDEAGGEAGDEVDGDGDGEARLFEGSDATRSPTAMERAEQPLRI